MAYQQYDMILMLIYFFSCCVYANDIAEISIDLYHLHNHYRAIHSASPLKRSANLEAMAVSHATSCDSRHSGGDSWATVPYNSGIRNAGKNVAARWYSENQAYHNGYSRESGHFTQMVWKNTKEIGCAAGFCKVVLGTAIKNSYFIVCHYYPAGNVVEQFRENVK
eukprot:Partr_v1_DN31787_c0_g1_i1_m16322 putative GLI pathogenesis-related 2